MKMPFFGRMRELRDENIRLRSELESFRQASFAKNTIVDLRDGIAIVDAQGQIEYINSHFARMLNIDRRQYQGRPLSHFDALFGREKILEFLAREVEEVRHEIQRLIRLEQPANGSILQYVIKVQKVENRTQFLFEDHTLEQSIDDLFKRYVAPSVVEQLKKQKHNPFSAELREITVLFADLRGFTLASELIEPARVRLMINDFFSAMMEVVNRHQGTLDKFIGDGLMVLFGAPLAMIDHAARAVRTAIEMQRAHCGLAKLWAELGLPALDVGIGINSGKMIVGNIGSADRLDYTALGHGVNLASRICDAAAAREILISSECLARTQKEFKMGEARDLSTTGLKGPVRVVPVEWR